MKAEAGAEAPLSSTPSGYWGRSHRIRDTKIKIAAKSEDINPQATGKAILSHKPRGLIEKKVPPPASQGQALGGGTGRNYRQAVICGPARLN